MNEKILIASSFTDRLNAWKEGLSDFAVSTLLVDKSSSLCDIVSLVNPRIFFIDFDLIGLGGIDNLRLVCTETKAIVVGDAISEEVEWKFLKAGVRGCCAVNFDPKILRQVAESVNQGELWIRRALTCRLINELGDASGKFENYRQVPGLLNKLTQREYDIAVRVKNGESNKQIARACSITERTVKAHLTVAFQKLGVADRLNLARVLSAEEKNGASGGAVSQSASGGPGSYPNQISH